MFTLWECTIIYKSWGCGIEKIELECRNHDIPIPEYKYLPSNFMLEINATEMLNNIRKQSLLDSKGKASDQKRWPETHRQTTGTTRYTDTNTTISRKKLSSLLKINESAVQKRLDTLKGKGIPKREGAAKGGYWKILILP